MQRITKGTLIHAPVPAQIIDKGIPTAGLLAQVQVAKYSDHLPLYRQELIFGRAGVPLPRSLLIMQIIRSANARKGQVHRRHS